MIVTGLPRSSRPTSVARSSMLSPITRTLATRPQATCPSADLWSLKKQWDRALA